MTPQPDEATLVDEIAASIRGRIMNGDFPIGSPLRQATLAAEFGVSRTPVREALRQLQSGGLITISANRGAIVRVPAPWEVRQAYEVRAELEAMAARRAATRITGEQLAELRKANDVLRRALDGRAAKRGRVATSAANDAFHTTIGAAAANPWLGTMVARINESFPRNVSSLVLADDERHRDENTRQHDAIIAALTDGKAERAADLMREHVVCSGEHVAAWYEHRSQTVFQAK
jgi:DNA-binding GntR family transcriptional regulator